MVQVIIDFEVLLLTQNSQVRFIFSGRARKKAKARILCRKVGNQVDICIKGSLLAIWKFWNILEISRTAEISICGDAE